MALESRKPVGSIYDKAQSGDEDGVCILDKIASEVDEQNLITNKIAITQLINNLDERERQVIFLRYYKGQTQTETAKILNTNQVQISRIEKKVLQSMKRKLTV